MRIRSVLQHTGQVIAEGALISLLVVGLVAGTAFAGRPTGGTTSGSLTVADGVYASTTAVSTGTAYAWAHAECSQGGTVVYSQWIKTDAAGRGTFTLGPTPMWRSGAADCWAESGTWQKSRWRQAATTTFHVAA